METRASGPTALPRRRCSRPSPNDRDIGLDDGRPALAIGIAASIVVLALGLSPTGSGGADALVVVVTATAAVWAGTAAPWWTAFLLGSAAAAAAGTWWAVVAGVAGAVFAVLTLVIPAWRRTAMAGAVAAGLVAVAGARTIGPFGGSAVIGIAGVGVLAAVGATGLSPTSRRRLVIGSTAVLTVCVAAVVGLAAAALGARDDLERGKSASERALASIRAGDLDEAQLQFSFAATSFRRADVTLRRPWAQPSRLVPVLAQHRAAGENLANAAASTSRTLDVELGALDLDALRVDDGRIDIEAVSALSGPLDRVNATIDRLHREVRTSASPWLLPPVRDMLDELAVDLSEQQEVGTTAARALDVAPAMLGGDGPRRYFVMFTTPAEARGLGGFMGNYAELTVDDGHISLTGFGRHKELTLAADDDRRLIDAPDDWLARYGTFGFTNGPDGTTGTAPWANITMSPHFPSTAQVAAELYPQSGGRRVDGVFSLDVLALERIVGLVGPIEVEGVPTMLDGSNTASFLLVGQYAIDDESERTDLLETMARETLDRLIGGSAPHPVDLGQALVPMVRERRVLAWSDESSEQAMFADVGLDGALLGDLNGADGIAVTVDNASGNKIDTFLEREFEMIEVPDEPGSFEVTVRLHNDAPLDLPDYVVGNLVNLPRGSSRLFVSIHTTMRLVTANDAGGSIGLQPATEAGFPVYSAYVDIPAGEWVEWRLVFERTSRHVPVVIEPQPLVLPARLKATATTVGCDDRLATRRAINAAGPVGPQPAVGCAG